MACKFLFLEYIYVLVFCCCCFAAIKIHGVFLDYDRTLLIAICLHHLKHFLEYIKAHITLHFGPYHSHVHYIKTETSFCICAHLQTHNKPDLHTKSAQCEIITRLSDTLTIFILWRILCYVQFFFVFFPFFSGARFFLRYSNPYIILFVCCFRYKKLYCYFWWVSSLS